MAIALLHLVVDYDDAAHPASLSFQHKDRPVQRRGKGLPGGVGAKSHAAIRSCRHTAMKARTAASPRSLIY
jgi:hypothetical protein